ncbi:SMP-30/gluconolactonase/LRE family protein [Rhodococcus sp. IEGM 1307]|uniref:SMP-30/gluconolactonase/LRE family protein n=1 Tax=Rhodococcus sp. IEGM 1307 TaxID=3047091 RepID=UPI0024B83A69|nr:SMP-30/gluconolactonase/LRE family protein [Rhodococcus sp. IEGM 1307]MDI9975630.1 SMP-30/gluconolactonase/LRE family protein [Rhodococcus sp. IEGM 1307]
MKNHSLQTISSGHGYLEAPRWHDGRLWASDFFGKHVLHFEEDGSHTAFATLEESPSGLGFLQDGSVLVVLLDPTKKKVVRIAPDGSVSEYADIAHIARGMANDMLVSPSGHAYIGNFGFDLGAEDPKATTLAHVTPEGNVSRVEGDAIFPNGAALSADGRTLLLAETFGHRIDAFDVNADGSLTNFRVWAQLDESMHPDGIALDTEGGVWFGNGVTNGPESGFYRVEESGEITDSVLVPDAWAVACTFGGSDLDVLYMFCNATTLEQFGQGKSQGTVRTAQVNRRGVAQ